MKSEMLYQSEKKYMLCMYVSIYAVELQEIFDWQKNINMIQ